VHGVSNLELMQFIDHADAAVPDGQPVSVSLGVGATITVRHDVATSAFDLAQGRTVRSVMLLACEAGEC